MRSYWTRAISTRIRGKIIWTKDKDFWIKLKRHEHQKIQASRPDKTDLDVKNKWIEVIKFQDKIWVVRWYQNIKLYEMLHKPSVVWKCEWCQQNLSHYAQHLTTNYLFNGSNQLYKLDDSRNAGTFMNFMNPPTPQYCRSMNFKLYKLLTIFDPCMIWNKRISSNYLWYDFIWSDIDITHLEKQNTTRQAIRKAINLWNISTRYFWSLPKEK